MSPTTLTGTLIISTGRHLNDFKNMNLEIVNVSVVLHSCRVFEAFTLPVQCSVQASFLEMPKTPCPPSALSACLLRPETVQQFIQWNAEYCFGAGHSVK